jgi:hypothetical protein
LPRGIDRHCERAFLRRRIVCHCEDPRSYPFGLGPSTKKELSSLEAIAKQSSELRLFSLALFALQCCISWIAAPTTWARNDDRSVYANNALRARSAAIRGKI